MAEQGLIGAVRRRRSGVEGARLVAEFERSGLGRKEFCAAGWVALRHLLKAGECFLAVLLVRVHGYFFRVLAVPIWAWRKELCRRIHYGQTVVEFRRRLANYIRESQCRH